MCFMLKELEVRYEYILKENRRLVDKVAEIITEKQDLEDTIKRKNDLLKFKVYVICVSLF